MFTIPATSEGAGTKNQRKGRKPFSALQSGYTPNRCRCSQRLSPEFLQQVDASSVIDATLIVLAPFSPFSSFFFKLIRYIAYSSSYLRRGGHEEPPKGEKAAGRTITSYREVRLSPQTWGAMEPPKLHARVPLPGRSILSERKSSELKQC